jgi:hypothetical protein
VNVFEEGFAVVGEVGDEFAAGFLDQFWLGFAAG